MTTFTFPVSTTASEPSPKRHWIRWLAPALLGVVLATAWWWGPQLFHRLSVARLQQQCLSHLAPQGQVSYADAGLMGAEPYRAVPPVWEALANQMNAETLVPAAAPFVGQCLDRAGRRRLVIVELLDPRPQGIHRVLDARVRVLEISSWQGPRVLRDQMILGAARLPAGQKVRVFAGRSDPQDPSHFTIDYQLENAAPGTIDGWVKTGDRVFLQERASRMEMLTLGMP